MRVTSIPHIESIDGNLAGWLKLTRALDDDVHLDAFTDLHCGAAQLRRRLDLGKCCGRERQQS
jgi:hypothetical protein